MGQDVGVSLTVNVAWNRVQGGGGGGGGGHFIEVHGGYIHYDNKI